MANKMVMMPMTGRISLSRSAVQFRYVGLSRVQLLATNYVLYICANFCLYWFQIHFNEEALYKLKRITYVRVIEISDHSPMPPKIKLVKSKRPQIRRRRRLNIQGKEY